jgi:hypothetical protein
MADHFRRTTTDRQLRIAEQGGQPERRIGRILKSTVLGRRRVTLVRSSFPVHDERCG